MKSMDNLEERYKEIEGVVFKMDHGDFSFYAQVVLADPDIGITAKALEYGRWINEEYYLFFVDKGEEVLCLNNKNMLNNCGEIFLRKGQLVCLLCIENRYLNVKNVDKYIYGGSRYGSTLDQCAFQ